MAKNTMNLTFAPTEEVPELPEREMLEQSYKALAVGWHEENEDLREQVRMYNE